MLVNPEDVYLRGNPNKGDRCSLGLAYIGAYLKKFGHQVDYFDLNHDKEEDLLKFVEENQSKFICFALNMPLKISTSDLLSSSCIGLICL